MFKGRQIGDTDGTIEKFYQYEVRESRYKLKSVAYDEGLADRVRSIFRARGNAFHRSVLEKRMFGGLVFMIHGNMCCGVRNRELMLRLGPGEADAALRRPHTRPVDPSRKRIRSLIFIKEEGIDLDSDLEDWVEIAVKFVEMLEPKAPSAKPKLRQARRQV